MNESKPRDCAANCGVILSQFMYTCTTQVSCITLSVREDISLLGRAKSLYTMSTVVLKGYLQVVALQPYESKPLLAVYIE